MNSTPFGAAIAADMERLHLNDRQLGLRLGVTQQAAFKWRARGFPPASRVNELIQVLGADSQVARLTPGEMFATPKAKSKTQTTAADPRKELTRKATEKAEIEFLAGLPPSLRGAFTLEVDDILYASTLIKLEMVVRVRGGARLPAYGAALRVLAAKTAGATPVVAVITDTPDEYKTLKGSLATAARAGVHICVVESGAHLARQVIEMEQARALPWEAEDAEGDERTEDAEDLEYGD